MAFELRELRAGLSWSAAFATVCGGLAGVAAQLNALAVDPPKDLTLSTLVARALIGLFCGVAIALPTFLLTAAWLPRRFGFSADERRRFLRLHAASDVLFLSLGLGAFGVLFPPALAWVLLAAFIVANAVAVALSLTPDRRAQAFASPAGLCALFFVSGIAALVYQVTWERALYTSFGVNIESVTVVVTLFMFGLGLGSLFGGALSKRFGDRVPLLFMASELSVGAFGAVSLPLIRAVGDLTVQKPLPISALAIFALLSFPTLMMGATLPILVTHLHARFRHVGRSVGLLYFANTLGSAVACYITVDVLFVIAGQQVAVLFAAGCNAAVGLLVFRYARVPASAASPDTPPTPEVAP
ncbi:MAG: hypothetical protein IRZ16_06120 [Myxococcaceae bacterium]|nr:hypothetical protein [Myxococcaceae bacterium]